MTMTPAISWRKFAMFLLSVKVVLAVFIAIVCISFVSSDHANPAIAAVPLPTPGAEKKVMSEYRGVSIGMSADAVRSKLGGPKDKSDAMDLYMFGDSETAQFYYDASKLVTAIMITYSGDLKNAPSPKDVLGEDAEARADGSIFKIVRFPKAGFWISYNRTAPPDAIVNIALQKM